MLRTVVPAFLGTWRSTTSSHDALARAGVVMARVRRRRGVREYAAGGGGGTDTAAVVDGRAVLAARVPRDRTRRAREGDHGTLRALLERRAR